MPKKLTYKEVKQYFEDQGCELLEKEYVNSKTTMKYKCNCGNISKICFYNFKAGNRCKMCGIKKRIQSRKYPLQYVQQYFKDNGCELLEQEYKNNSIKMEYQCECGNISHINFNHFQQGKRCIKCGGTEKLTYEYVKQYFLDQGCELLEKKYINNRTLMQYKCNCGDINYIMFCAFQSGRRCKKCGTKKLSGENNYKWIKNRQLVQKNNMFNNKCRSALKRCLKQIAQSKTDRTANLLGYTVQQLKNYIQNHPNWTNIDKNNWHLDHIFPIKAFLDHNIKDLKLINCLDNLQPLSKKINLSKGYKYNQKEFKKWIKNKAIDEMLE